GLLELPALGLERLRVGERAVRARDLRGACRLALVPDHEREIADRGVLEVRVVDLGHLLRAQREPDPARARGGGAEAVLVGRRPVRRVPGSPRRPVTREGGDSPHERKRDDGGDDPQAATLTGTVPLEGDSPPYEGLSPNSRATRRSMRPWTLRGLRPVR